MPFCRNEVQTVSKTEISQPKNPITEKIGRRIRENRKRNGLTQGQVAALADISLGAQHRYESGTADAGATYLAHLAKAGFDVLWLVTGERCRETLSPETADLVGIFESMPPDMRAGVLHLVRSMSRYIMLNGLDRPGPMQAEYRLLHDSSSTFRSEPED